MPVIGAKPDVAARPPEVQQSLKRRREEIDQKDHIDKKIKGRLTPMIPTEFPPELSLNAMVSEKEDLPRIMSQAAIGDKSKLLGVVKPIFATINASSK